MTSAPLPNTPPRRSFPVWLIVVLVVAGLAMLGVCAIVSIGVLTLLGQRVDPTPTVITASDGQSQVTVPASWQTSTELNAAAELQVSNPLQEQYLIVLTESKSDFTEMDLETYTQIVLEGLAENVSGADITGPQSLTLNQQPALQYEVRGTVENLNVVYWLTVVEGTQNYYQVLTWTLASKAEANRPVFQQVIESFQEIVL